MKAFAAAIVLFLGASQLHAEEIQFWLNRFGGIFIATAKGKERVRVFQGNKETEDTIFESRLIPSAPGTYATPKGTVFALKHLETPIINDAKRRINSGDWQLTVSGKGTEFDRLKIKIPFVAFVFFHPFVYLGEKAE